MLYAFNGGVLSTENEDNFVRNLATIKVGDVYYTVPLWPYSAIPPTPGPTVTKKQKLSTSALDTPIFTVDELKQWLHVDDSEDDLWMLPLMEAAAHIHVQNYLRIEFDDTCGENVKIAMLTLVGHWYRNREAVTIGERAALEVPMMFSQLLAPERDYSEAYSVPESITSVQDAKIRAGDLDRRVTLKSPVYNEYSDEIVGYEDVAVVWAAVLPNFAQEQVQSERTIEVILAFVVIRYRADVDARWQVIDKEHTYEITGMVDALRARQKLILSCKEVL